MRVGLVGVEGDFDTPDISDIKKRSNNRYMSQLYSSLYNLNAKGPQVDKIEVPHMPVGLGFSLMFGTMFKNLSNYDILHNPDSKPFFPKNKGRAIVVSTAHGFEFIFDVKKDVDRSSVKGIFRHSVIIPLAYWSLKRSDYMIAISSLTKNDAIRWGYDKDRIFVVNHGIDAKFINAKKSTRKEHSKFRIGYIGTFRIRKNIGMAIEAIKKIDDSNIVFEVWGKRMFQYELFARQARGDNRIMFMGPAPEDRIVQTYDSFDAFVFPTTYESFGFPIIEAQARGLPVIINKHGRVSAEVRKYCLKAESPEHMAQIIEDLKENGYNEKLRKKATEYAKSFTWEKCAEETFNVYKTISGK
ncbi:MAG: glycosyltransferase [Candidatus Marsarchaeota archaeon]|jgi:glycosyltransferase involved in cell wall biosynthesis|nr:glycosyltransferase [Candidatus Marsarchaeota archaeon]MCL5418781.1 glycosyltransferase [Candidatus Marsarchaeota archaeon]